MSPVVHFANWLTDFGISSELLAQALGTFAVIVAYVVLRRIFRRLAGKAVDDPAARYQINKAIGYALGLVAIAALARIWMQNVTGFATYLGLLSAGVAIALQDPIINLAGWLFIIARRPFTVGDRIQIGQHSGDVVDVRIFQFTLMEIGNWVHSDQSTGRVIHVPNGWVFKHTVANYDKGFSYLWNELEVLVTYESDWRRAKEVLLKTVNEHAEHLSADARRQIDQAAERYHIKFSKLTPVVWTSLADSGVRLTMRYLCKPRERRSSQHEIWEAVLDAFRDLPDVDFAYPTVRHFDNPGEGKRPARAPDGDARPSPAEASSEPRPRPASEAAAAAFIPAKRR
jgi:small-conductance mechanosensitive channel